MDKNKKQKQPRPKKLKGFSLYNALVGVFVKFKEWWLNPWKVYWEQWAYKKKTDNISRLYHW